MGKRINGDADGGKKANRVVTRPALCRTCLSPVSWRYSEALRVWQAFEVDSAKPHRCGKESA